MAALSKEEEFIMEHDFSLHGSFTVAAIQMLLGISMLFQGVLRKHNIAGRLVKLIVPYVYSFSPVVFLVYMLYVVSSKLI
jgi:hypothetical protein